MSGQEQGTGSQKAREAESERRPDYDHDSSAPPPAYDEIANDYNNGYNRQQAVPPTHQQQYHSFPPTSGASYAPPLAHTQPQTGYDNKPPPQNYHTSPYDPMQDPNVIKIPANIVNITQTNPAYLNPSYQQYLERDQQRIQQGNFPNPNGPLNTGTNNPKRSSGGSSSFFPGKSGATYNNAANK